MSDPIGRRTAANVPVPGETTGASETVAADGRAVASGVARRPAPSTGGAPVDSAKAVDLREQRFSVVGGGNDTGASGGRRLADVVNRIPVPTRDGGFDFVELDKLGTDKASLEALLDARRQLELPVDARLLKAEIGEDLLLLVGWNANELEATLKDVNRRIDAMDLAPLDKTSLLARDMTYCYFDRHEPLVEVYRDHVLEGHDAPVITPAMDLLNKSIMTTFKQARGRGDENPELTGAKIAASLATMKSALAAAVSRRDDAEAGTDLHAKLSNCVDFLTMTVRNAGQMLELNATIPRT